MAYFPPLSAVQEANFDVEILYNKLLVLSREEAINMIKIALEKAQNNGYQTVLSQILQQNAQNILTNQQTLEEVHKLKEDLKGKGCDTSSAGSVAQVPVVPVSQVSKIILLVQSSAEAGQHLKKKRRLKKKLEKLRTAFGSANGFSVQAQVDENCFSYNFNSS